MANSTNQSATSGSFSVYTGLSIVTVALFLILLGMQVAEFLFYQTM